MSRSIQFLWVLILCGAVPLAGQRGTSPQDIAARAGSATVEVRSLDAGGNVSSTGSGFFVASDGVIVTNFHVIEDASSLQVETASGEIYDNVYYITSDPRRDIAILKIPIEGVEALSLGQDEEAAVGSAVYVMGNPLGQAGTFSNGIVSARRTLEGVAMVQITAPISPGSSGGPVMDSSGAVIGVATLILTGGQNLNYSVPVRYIRPLLSTGESPRPFTSALLPTARGGLASLGAPAPSAPSTLTATSALIANADDEWERQVYRKIELAELAVRDNGWVRSHEIVTGSLDDSDSEDITARLEAGVQYGIVAVCDDDCTDLDLEAYDPDMDLLDDDFALDATPIVIFTPGVTDRYTVRVIMATCEAEPCRYGVAIFQAP